MDMSGGDNVQGILGAIGPFWAKWGLGPVLQSPSSFYEVIQRTVRQLCNGQCSPDLVTKRSSLSRRGKRNDIFETSHLRGHLPPKSEIENQSNRLRDALQTDTVYSTLHSKDQGVSKIQSTFLYDVRLQSYGVSKLPNFRILAYFLYTKPLKRTFW